MIIAVIILLIVLSLSGCFDNKNKESSNNESTEGGNKIISSTIQALIDATWLNGFVECIAEGTDDIRINCIGRNMTNKLQLTNGASQGALTADCLGTALIGTSDTRFDIINTSSQPGTWLQDDNAY